MVRPLVRPVTFLLFGLGFALAACNPVSATITTSDPPPQRREPVARKPASDPSDFDAAAALDGAEQALLTVDELRTRPNADVVDPADMHSYLPDEGLRPLYYYASIANLSLLKFAGMFGTSVFVAGPHGDALEFGSEIGFGHYNPEFVERVIETARLLGSDPARVERTQLAFERQLHSQASTYLAVYHAMHRDPAWFERFKLAYVDSIAAPNQGFSMSDEAVLMNDSFARAGMSWYEADTAGFFWVRRHIDGTDELWVEAIEALLDAYGADRPG